MKMSYHKFFTLGLVAIIKEKSMKQVGIARNAGLSPKYLNDIIHGRADASQKAQEAIANAMGLTVEGLYDIGRNTLAVTGTMSGAVPMSKCNITAAPAIARRVPLISWVRAGEWTEVEDSPQPGDAEDWVNTTVTVGEGAFALRVRGDSMEPVFQEGDLLVVDPARQAENGQYVVAKNGDGEATFKRFVRESGRMFLSPLNNRYPVVDVTDHDFRIIGVVVEKVTRFV